MLKELAKQIIESVDFATNCRGLQAKDQATEIARILFENENLSFENWQVTEIPVATFETDYPTNIEIICYNATTDQEVSLGINLNGDLTCASDEEYNELNTITEALIQSEENDTSIIIGYYETGSGDFEDSRKEFVISQDLSNIETIAEKLKFIAKLIAVYEHQNKICLHSLARVEFENIELYHYTHFDELQKLRQMIYDYQEVVFLMEHKI